MNDPWKSTTGLSTKQDGGAVVRHENREYVAKPTLYSSVVETEFKLRQISQFRPEPKPIAIKVCLFSRRKFDDARNLNRNYVLQSSSPSIII